MTRSFPVDYHTLSGAAAVRERSSGAHALGGLELWITPNDKFFSIAHYNRPVIDEKTWRLDVGPGSQPLTLTLSELKALPRQEVTSTLECSGNNGLPFAPARSAMRNGRARRWPRRCERRRSKRRHRGGLLRCGPGRGGVAQRHAT